METGATNSSLRKTARIAGITYLLTTVIVIYSYFGISSHIIVPKDFAQTAKNILANESSFRLVIVCHMLYCAGLIVFLSALYSILKYVDRQLAMLAAFLRFVYALIWIFIALNLFVALRLISGGANLQVFETNRLQALASLHLSGMDAYYVGLLFWSLAAVTCAYLWYRSGYVAKAFSAFGIVASVWCVFCTIAYIIDPGFANTINLWWFDTPMFLFEIAISCWLLFGRLRIKTTT